MLLITDKFQGIMEQNHAIICNAFELARRKMGTCLTACLPIYSKRQIKINDKKTARTVDYPTHEEELQGQTAQKIPQTNSQTEIQSKDNSYPLILEMNFH